MTDTMIKQCLLAPKGVKHVIVIGLTTEDARRMKTAVKRMNADRQADFKRAADAGSAGIHSALTDYSDANTPELQATYRYLSSTDPYNGAKRPNVKVGETVRWKQTDMRAWTEAPPRGRPIQFGWRLHEEMKKEKYEVLMVFHQAGWTSVFCRGTTLTGGVGFWVNLWK